MMPFQRTGVRMNQSADDLHQGALAGAVFTHERVYLTHRHAQVHVVVRQYGGVALGDAAQDQSCFSCHGESNDSRG